MFNTAKMKYLFTLTNPLFFALSLMADGWRSWSAILYGFTFIPLLDLLFPVSREHRSESAEKDRFYDLLLYLMVPLQYSLLILFLFRVQEATDLLTWSGHVLTFGLSCGVLGINLGHELGHRRSHWEQTLAQVNLMSSLYMHFFIEHNQGHHQRVATPQDPASARYGEGLYSFLHRSICGSWRSAWAIERQRLERNRQPLYSWHNRMLVYIFCELSLLGLIVVTFGPKAVGSFALSALLGIFLLEAINYIEHYGLSRQKGEGVRPLHSWNSEHLAGRILLFNLPRHSDHHQNARKKYQMLGPCEEGPQLPTGYPGMILLSLFPPLWFKVMNPRVDALQSLRFIQTPID